MSERSFSQSGQPPRTKNPERQGLQRAAALLLLAGSLGAISLHQSALADTSVLTPSKDNTLYQTVDGSLSNGLGQWFFAGRTAAPQGFSRLRAVLKFDLACRIPQGALVTGAALALNMDRTIVGPQAVALHRLAASWGEGTSDAQNEEGGGDPSTIGDATWIHTFYDTAFWTTPGGDYEAAPSATAIVDQNGPYTWSSAAMAADVQAWVDSPGSNNGWILIGEEASAPTAKRFASKDNPAPELRPSLLVSYTGPAGRVPDGAQAPGTQLKVVKADEGAVTLSWGASCRCSDNDYEVYEGSLGNFTSHLPVQCSTGNATTATFVPGGSRRYFLVVPRNASREGSYGVDSSLAERPPSASACLTQQIGGCD